VDVPKTRRNASCGSSCAWKADFTRANHGPGKQPSSGQSTRFQWLCSGRRHAALPGAVAARRCPQLTMLTLSNTQVTGTGLKELAGLKRLTFLELRGTQVTEDGPKELVGLKQLATLT
jgi:hypothetical protein